MVGFQKRGRPGSRLRNWLQVLTRDRLDNPNSRRAPECHSGHHRRVAVRNQARFGRQAPKDRVCTTKV